MCLSPSRGAWEQTKLFSHLSSQLEQGEVQACCFPSPRIGIEGQRSKVPHTRDLTLCPLQAGEGSLEGYSGLDLISAREGG